MHTRTYVLLDVSRATYEEVRAKLELAGYGHVFIDDAGGQRIDMHGIALRANPHEKLDADPDPE